MSRILSYFIASVLLILANNVNAQRMAATFDPQLEPFYHGVGSGDPLADRVIIWTRVTPDSTVTNSVIVQWRIALDTGMTQIIQSGVTITGPNADYTVKVDVQNLQANTTYYYEFTALNKNSQRGRTKTTPSGNCDSLRFAVVSCANYEAGFFNVYRIIAERNDIDVVIALGDYIYEYESGGYSPNQQANRTWLPANEIIALTDYRQRYSSYHLDPDLMLLHQQFPWIAVWDDHESANDAWMNGAENHTPATEGAWSIRRAAAVQAYLEWMPIRTPDPNNTLRIYRHITFGNLVEFDALDTRLIGRDMQDGTTSSNVFSSTRQLLGTAQYSWLASRLDSSNARWKVLTQQVMMAPLEIFSVPVNGDQWDGYPAERGRIYNHILTNNIKDVFVITGDIHSSWANDLPGSSYNASNGAGSVGVEFVTPSVTSPGLSLPLGASAIMAANGHIKFCNLDQNGFIILDINHQRSQSDWYFVSTIDNASTQFSYADSWYVNDLERHLRHSNSAAVPRNGLTSIVQAPYLPRNFSITTTIAEQPAVLVTGLYPNPAEEYVYFSFVHKSEAPVQVTILDQSGRIVDQEEIDYGIGTFSHQLSIGHLPAGSYYVRFISDGRVMTTRQLVKTTAH